MTESDKSAGDTMTAPLALPPSLARPCVLIIDDQPANVALMSRLLRAAGIHDLHAVTDAREAVARFLEVSPDLVLLDLHMPHIDGFGVLSVLREALSDDDFVPVLALTADTTAPTRDRALQAGAKDFLSKPFERTEALLRIRNLLETRALYVEAQRHNASLRADLAARATRERREAEQFRRRRRRIDDALASGAITMVLQPIAALDDGTVLGAEALARFSCEPQRTPDRWFDEAAQVGRGLELELAAVRAAVGHVGALPAGAFLSVNVSASTAADPALRTVLEGVPAQRLVLELTEHARIEDYPRLLGQLAPLRRRGVRIAVDDAGAGYAGLRHVLALRPDIIKLDNELTRSIDTDPARRALATALVTFSREVGAVIIAEGVETAAELQVLRRLAIPWGQGYHLARPGRPPLPSALVLASAG